MGMLIVNSRAFTTKSEIGAYVIDDITYIANADANANADTDANANANANTDADTNCWC